MSKLQESCPADAKRSPVVEAGDKQITPSAADQSVAALALTRAGRPAAVNDRLFRRIPRTLLLGAGGFLGAISWQVVVPVLPLHLSRIGYTAPQIGILISILSLAMGVVEMQVGWIVGAFGRRQTLVGGLVANAACMALVALARMAALVASTLAAIGIARATLWPPLHATVADTASAETRGRAFGIFWFWTSVAFLTGPLIGGLVAAHYGDRSAFYLGAAFSLLAIPVVSAVTSGGRDAARVSSARVGDVLGDVTFLRLCIVNHLYYSMAGIWMTFLPLYMARRGLSVEVVGLVLTVQGFTYALVQIPTGRLADRFGPEWIVLPAIGGRALIATLLPIFQVQSSAGFLIAGALYGFAGGMIPVTFTTLVSRMVRQEKYTTAMGIYNSSGDLGFFIGPLLGGVAALLGIRAAFLLCLPLGTASALIALTGIAAAERSQEPL